MSDDLAVVHDFFSIRGGGERLVLTLAQELGQALVYGYWTAESYDHAETSGLLTHDLHARVNMDGVRILALAYAFRYKTKRLASFKKVVYSGDLAPFAVYQHEGGNLYYCHTPPRLAYDQYELHRSRVSPWSRPLLHGLVAWLRHEYTALLPRMERIVANSEHVRQRIQHYWQRDAVVIHPPCDTHLFNWIGQEDFYLSTARLEPLKRVDRIVAAFIKMADQKLVVASGGSELSRLRALAKDAPNIQFTGWLDGEQMQELTGRARATIYAPHNEDFGISPIESMSAGKPVIACAEGGLLETVLHDQTGWMMPPSWTEEDLLEAVRLMTPKRALSMRQECEKRATEFDRAHFIDKMRAILETL